MKDAEIGCGVDANVNAKCLRPPSDAALSDPLDASVATDTATAGIDGAGTDNVSAPVDGATAIDTGGSD